MVNIKCIIWLLNLRPTILTNLRNACIIQKSTERCLIWQFHMTKLTQVFCPRDYIGHIAERLLDGRMLRRTHAAIKGHIGSCSGSHMAIYAINPCVWGPYQRCKTWIIYGLNTEWYFAWSIRPWLWGLCFKGCHYCPCLFEIWGNHPMWIIYIIQDVL